jgi:hypothetical protein
VALLNIAAIVYAPAADGPGVALLNIAAIVYAPAADGPGVALLLTWRWPSCPVQQVVTVTVTGDGNFYRRHRLKTLAL